MGPRVGGPSLAGGGSAGPASDPQLAGSRAPGPTARPPTPATVSRDLAPREAEEPEGMEMDADYDGNPEE
eukprot:3109636-Pyramimonas_sp.AAC.1